jgi:hypothetical protein
MMAWRAVVWRSIVSGLAVIITGLSWIITVLRDIHLSVTDRAGGAQLRHMLHRIGQLLARFPNIARVPIRHV